MLHNEIINELQKLIRKIIIELETSNAFLRAEIDSISLLCGAAKDDLDVRFVNIVLDLDKNRNRTPEIFLSAFQSLDRLLATQIYIESVKLREGGLGQVLTFFHVENEDRRQLLEHCAHIRDLLLKSVYLDEFQRRRLLRKVSAMEIEINKENGMLDTITSGVSEIGDAARKFGNDLKPLTDRVNDIFSIAKKFSDEPAGALEAPTELKRLPAPDQAEQE